MRRYSVAGVVVMSVALLVVAGGCRTKKPAPPPLGGIPGENKGDILSPTDVKGMGDLIAPVPPMPSEREADGSRITDAVFANVMFEFDSFRVAPSEVQKIESVADFMRKNPATKLVTEGHCDERGSNEYNMSLGEHRAQAVRAYMVGLGVDASRIQTRSFGEEKPSDPNHNENAWRMNRRVEFALFR